MTAGHAIPFVILHQIYEPAHEIGNKIAVEGNRLEVGQGVPRANRRKEHVADERQIPTQEQDEDRQIEIPPRILQIERMNESGRQEKIT